MEAAAADGGPPLPPGKYQRAVEILERDPEQGVVELEVLARKYAKDPSVRHALGVAHQRLGEPAEALPHLEWVVGRRQEPAAYRPLIEAYMALNMLTHARRAADRAHQAGVTGLVSVPQPDPEIVTGAMTEKDRLAFERSRMEVFRGAPEGVARLESLAHRYPDAAAPINLVATGYHMGGDLAGYRRAVQEASERFPADIHALVNEVRLALLEAGPEAARALRRRVLDAATSAAEGIVNGELARAQALAYTDDAAGVRAALDTYFERDEGVANPVSEQLEGYLARRDDDPHAPLVGLRDLLAGFLTRWKGLGPKVRERAMFADLAAMRGILRVIPTAIGYEDEPLVQILALPLLSGLVPPPRSLVAVEDDEGDGAPATGRTPADAGDPPIEDGADGAGEGTAEGATVGTAEAWSEVLRRVALEGPGTARARLALLTTLVDHGFADGDGAVSFEGSEGALRPRLLQLSDEPEPSGLADADQDRFEGSYEAMLEDDFAAARPVLEDLVERYPESASVAFNLAVAENVAGGEAEERAEERLEALVREHPGYLFAKAQVAVMALEEGNLERARELLRFPEDQRSFHVQEYAAFASAQGRLAIAMDEPGAARVVLDVLGERIGEDALPYSSLRAALLRTSLEKVGASGLFEKLAAGELPEPPDPPDLIEDDPRAR